MNPSSRLPIRRLSSGASIPFLAALAAAVSAPTSPGQADRESSGDGIAVHGLSVTPHVRSEIMQYRRGPAPGLGALVRLFLRNESEAPVVLDAAAPLRFDGSTPNELVASGDWAWHDAPEEGAGASIELPPGALTVVTFNSSRDAWGAGTAHEIAIGAGSPPRSFALAPEPVTISALTFLGDSVLAPDRAVVHLANGGSAPVTIEAARFWLPRTAAGGSPSHRVFAPGEWREDFRPFREQTTVPAGDRGGFILGTAPLPLGYGVLEVRVREGGGETRSLWAHQRIRRESFDLSGGWVSSDVGGRNSLTLEPYLKLLKRMHLDTGHIEEVGGYTDDEARYAKYPLKRFAKLGDFARYDTDAMLPEIHAVEFLGEPQYGGGRPVPPMEVWQALAPYQPTRLPTTVTHSEERVWRFYAGLSDFPHYDAYRITAPAADAWSRYDRWGGEQIRWGAPLETIGEMTRSLRDLHRPAAVAYWSQGAHDGWGRYGGRERASPTPDELRAQAYHALGARITSLYWFNLSLPSLVEFRDLIDPITRVNREILVMAPLLLEGDGSAFERIVGDEGRPDWELAVVAGPRGAVAFAHDIAYRPDPEEKVFRFDERSGEFRFPLPGYLRDADLEVVQLTVDGVEPVAFERTGDGVVVRDDRIRVAGIYLVLAEEGFAGELAETERRLRDAEAAWEFDPAGNDADFATLRDLLTP